MHTALLRHRLVAYFELTKPRVNSLILFTLLIGMTLATPVVPAPLALLTTLVGVGLIAGAAAALNCLLDRTSDVSMDRTRFRPLPQAKVQPREVLIFSLVLCISGLIVLHTWSNALTLWLTLATFFGYAIVYTLWLKPLTPMNIVIGGASGAMPPVLGWCAIRGNVPPEAWSLFLIIFLWTPPHFWALACYRRADYAKLPIPMLPVTHGVALTCLHSLLYVVMLIPTSLLPYTLGMVGLFYATVALVFGAAFLAYCWRLWRHYSDDLARRTFRFSILYLFALFAALLADHFFRLWW